ncbi:MAG: OmpA family protein [Deltaproteobacteria bacterium]|nr:OmpA family protein [Deltaproteobacteria bacterium]
MKNPIQILRPLAIGGVIALVACATPAPPKDAVLARAAYARAEKGPAQQINPADLHVAKKQLDFAEAMYADVGDTPAARDQFYLALRRAELAESVARARKTLEARDAIVAQMHAEEKKTVAMTSAELGRTKTALAAQGEALQNERVKSAELKDKTVEMEAKAAEMEKRSAQMALELARIATVKQEPRGMVITLSGSVLFASAKSALLPAAQTRLKDVAKVLTREDPDSMMVVEGHTDSQGKDSYNQTLSEERAQAVREYLVSSGVATDRVSSKGFGSSRPVSENNTAEGRANNRRVEIIVSPAQAKLGSN